MTRPDISLIIVNWKVRPLLEKCLNSILVHRGGVNLEILVVDNDSCDGSPEMIMSEYPEVKMIALPSNHGFAKANNLAIKQAQGRWLFLLNPDTEITTGFFPTVLSYLEEHPEVGLLGTKILNPDGSLQYSVRRSPDFFSQLLTLLKLQNIIIDEKPLNRYLAKKFLPLVLKIRSYFSHNKIMPYYLAEDFDYEKIQAVEQLMGSAMMISHQVWEKLGPLDEKFFIWFEEVDYCLRARQAGIKIVYLPTAKIIHYGGESFNKKKALSRQLIFDHSLLYYFFKHKPLWQWFLLLLVMPLNILLTASYVLFLQVKEED
jgi:GT2 family glycosyltransferase